MRSAASFKGHPIHPTIIPFPFAFLLGALGFDIAGRVLDNPRFWQTGAALAIAGLVAALVAAVPGLIDYLRTVPPRSSGKRRATWHMILNLSTVALFAIGTVLRGNVAMPPDMLLLSLEGVGAAMLLVAGWMGGTLVTRNQIGVDHRYAGAGKWKDESLDAAHGRPLVAGDLDDLQVNQMKLLRVGPKRIVLARTEQGYAAFADRCTHRGASLADGVMICGTVQCPWHGSQFDARTGDVKAGPAQQAIEVYNVREQDGRVLLDL
jgi:nitrite reductase/ring-hydroxylating ferredoxin subunit/uncharacterized membrane protein